MDVTRWTSALSSERMFQVPRRHGVHGLVAAYVVLSFDRLVAVTDQFGRELHATHLVDRSGGGAAEAVWGDVERLRGP